MGGMDSGLTEAHHGLDNIGDRLLQGYGEFLRSYDENVKRTQSLTRLSSERIKTFHNAHTEFFQSLAEDGSIDYDRLVGRFSQEDVQNALVAFVASGVAHAVKSTRQDDFMEVFMPDPDMSDWPRGEIVRVTNVSDRQVISKYKSTPFGMRPTGRTKTAISGRIESTNLTYPWVTSDGGSLSIARNFGAEYRVSPLIDKRKGYLPTVRIEFLD